MSSLRRLTVIEARGGTMDCWSGRAAAIRHRAASRRRVAIVSSRRRAAGSRRPAGRSVGLFAPLAARHSPLAARHSPLAIRRSPFAARLCRFRPPSVHRPSVTASISGGSGGTHTYSPPAKFMTTVPDNHSCTTTKDTRSYSHTQVPMGVESGGGGGTGDASPAVEKSAGDVPPEIMIFQHLFS